MGLGVIPIVQYLLYTLCCAVSIKLQSICCNPSSASCTLHTMHISFIAHYLASRPNITASPSVESVPSRASKTRTVFKEIMDLREVETRIEARTWRHPTPKCMHSAAAVMHTLHCNPSVAAHLNLLPIRPPTPQRHPTPAAAGSGRGDAGMVAAADR
jgi:hypothetical protein